MRSTHTIIEKPRVTIDGNHGIRCSKETIVERHGTGLKKESVGVKLG